jgi:hypothetical protein
MTLQIITADERLATSTGVKMVIAGPAKIGKTSLVKTLDPSKTLVIDMEAGMLALDDCQVDSINVRAEANRLGVHPWDFLRDLTCIIAGPNPAVQDANKPYSRAHHAYTLQNLGSREALFGKYDTLFFDSITDTARHAFSWSQTQPEAFSDKKIDSKTGLAAPDKRGAYGLLGQEMVGGSGVFNQLKHVPDKNLIFVGLLDEVKDDFGRVAWEMQLDGGKTKRELSGIFDQIISMVEMKAQDGTPYRAFVCDKLNQWGYPAGDRSGRLDVIEEPHLGKLIAKMKGGSRTTHFDYTVPGAVTDATT